MSPDSIPAYSEFRCGNLGFAYNEAAFRHFLALERRRAHRSMRSLAVILVGRRKGGGRREQLTPQESTEVFDVLGRSVREVDFIGWYRDGRTAAAVVTLSIGAPADVTVQLQRRVRQAMSAELVHEVRVRTVRVGERLQHC